MSERQFDESVGETYLQISPNILESFPKSRPPVDMYRFNTAMARIEKIHDAEVRLTPGKQGMVEEAAQEGTLFLFREDYKVYARHLSKKLGLVLVEDNFKPNEVAEIFFLAFRDRMADFIELPKEGPLKEIVKDISILAEYLWIDPHRVAFLTKTLHKEYDLASHSVNTMFIGLAVFAMASGGKLERAEVVNLGLGLLVHDLGMVHVPKFITDKEQYLVRRDRESIEKHIDAGEKIMERLKIGDATVMECMTQHHERLDGTGYPKRLKGQDISMTGRLCALADSFSAIIGDRPYHDAKVAVEAARTLASDPKKYEPALTKMLLALVLKNYADAEPAPAEA